MTSETIFKFFFYFWRLAALVLIFYVINQNMALGRDFSYRPDWRQDNSRDHIGWYPSPRVSYRDAERSLAVLSEPLYLRVYQANDFKKLSLSGSLTTSGETVRLGLKQQSGEWQWRDINSESFDLDFDLTDVGRSRNYLDFILSIPDLRSTSTLGIVNDWQFSFSH